MLSTCQSLVILIVADFGVQINNFWIHVTRPKPSLRHEPNGFVSIIVVLRARIGMRIISDTTTHKQWLLLTKAMMIFANKWRFSFVNVLTCPADTIWLGHETDTATVEVLNKIHTVINETQLGCTIFGSTQQYISYAQNNVFL